MLFFKDPISRRVFLANSSGAAMALPFLPSLFERKGFAAPSTRPRRVIFLVWDNGVGSYDQIDVGRGLCGNSNWFNFRQILDNSPALVTQLTGTPYRQVDLTKSFPSNILAPSLGKYANQLLILGGLHASHDGHNHSLGYPLTCPKTAFPVANYIEETKNKKLEDTATSVDQIIAKSASTLKGRPPEPSIVAKVDFGYFIEGNCASWSRGARVPPMMSSQAIAQKYLQAVTGVMSKKVSQKEATVTRGAFLKGTVMDALARETNTLLKNPLLSNEDRQSLDGYVTTLVEMNREYTLTPNAAPILTKPHLINTPPATVGNTPPGGNVPIVTPPTKPVEAPMKPGPTPPLAGCTRPMVSPRVTLSSNIRQSDSVIKSYMNVIAASIKCQVTSVVSLTLLESDYEGGIDGVCGSGFHTSFIHGKDDSEVMNASKYFATYLGHLMDQLNVVEDSSTNETYLDNTAIVFTSTLGNGSTKHHAGGSHASKAMPIMIAGGKNFLNTGRYINFLAQGENAGGFPKGVPFNQVHVTLLQAMGVSPREYELTGGGFGYYTDENGGNGNAGRFTRFEKNMPLLSLLKV